MKEFAKKIIKWLATTRLLAYPRKIALVHFDPETDRYIIYYDDIAKGEGGGKIQIISNPPTGSYLVKDMVYNSESGRFMIEHNET